MGATRFDDLLRSLINRASRREVLAGVAGAAFGLEATRLDLVAKTKKRKKLKLNQFGCVNVGDPCRGKDSNCCSGICDGGKPRRGKKDRSRCVGHNVGICTRGQDACAQGPAQATQCGLTGSTCFCRRTTGGAGFCSRPVADLCHDCRTDDDCEELGFPSGSACVVYVQPGCGCPETDNRTCVYPCLDPA
jgi:hypothetical protein